MNCLPLLAQGVCKIPVINGVGAFDDSVSRDFDVKKCVNNKITDNVVTTNSKIEIILIKIILFR
jgi:hypothetical protein